MNILNNVKKIRAINSAKLSCLGTSRTHSMLAMIVLAINAIISIATAEDWLCARQQRLNSNGLRKRSKNIYANRRYVMLFTALFVSHTQATVLVSETSWQDFPIILEGVTPAHLENYIYELDGKNLGLSELTDVVSYNKFFQPFDLGTPQENSLQSFSYEHALEMIDAAQNEGLSVIIPLIWKANAGFPGDGQVSFPGTDNEQLITHDEVVKVQIPLQTNQLFFDYINYWQSKASIFIDALTTYDVQGTIWAYRGLDELRWWEGTEMELARTMRAVVGDSDERALVAYTPNHYLPEKSLLHTLVDKAIEGQIPNNPQLFEIPGPVEPAGHLANGVNVTDLYPVSLTVNLDESENIRPLFNHVIAGNYTGLALGDYAHTNRILAYHRVRSAKEAVTNIEHVYTDNGQPAPNHFAFHAPDLYGAQKTTAFEARHDFWAGLHEGQGLYLANLGLSFAHPIVWEQYVRGLRLIKTDMRPFLVNGIRSTLRVNVAAGVVQIAGNHYLANGFTQKPPRSELAMPDYMALNHTLLRIGNVAYLIVTQSVNQVLRFRAQLPDCVNSIEIVAGSSNRLVLEENSLRDAFAGIDGRVYRIEFEPENDCNAEERA